MASADPFGGLSLLCCGGYVLLGILALASLVAIIWALWKILTAKNETNWKILWAIVVLVTSLIGLGIIGVAIYYFVGHKERQA